jgi:thioredoxin reductase (NADPH)
MKEQSVKFGTEIVSETVTKVDFSARPFKLWLEGKEYEEDAITMESVIIATGATAKRMFIVGEQEFWQAGISGIKLSDKACAVCDGAVPIFRNKELAVVGGGDSACEEATFLTKYASKVYMLVRRDALRASKVMADRVNKNPKIEILWNQVPISAHGDSLLKSLKIQDTKTKETTNLDVNGLFYAIGHTPNTEVFKGQLEIGENGYINVQSHKGAASTFTSVPGVFACGDVQDYVYRQAITAAGNLT